MLAEGSELFEQYWGIELSVIVGNAALSQTSQGNLQLFSLCWKMVYVNHSLASCQVVDCNPRGAVCSLADVTGYEINIYTWSESNSRVGQEISTF